MFSYFLGTAFDNNLQRDIDLTFARGMHTVKISKDKLKQIIKEELLKEMCSVSHPSTEVVDDDQMNQSIDPMNDQTGAEGINFINTIFSLYQMGARVRVAGD